MRRPFQGKRIVLGVTGGIASYKSAWLSRLLSKAGASVDVVMTRAASEFIGAITFEALTGRAVHRGLFDDGRALDHITLAKAADVLVVAPATADFLARAATGQADDLLSAVLLATTAPVVLVPAMNDQMWAHPQTRANVSRLRELGYTVVEPDEGELAAGEGSGPGRMPEPEMIVEHVARALEPRASLASKRILVTAGPTREIIDPVRFISNRSSGRMGVAIAQAAWSRGAEVVLVAGPLEVSPPVGVRVESVESTAQMAAAVERELGASDVLIMAAAPGDFRPARAATSKIKKDGSTRSIDLAPTADILATTRSSRKKGAVVVGFALETDDPIANGRGKLAAKDLDLVVVNDATEAGAGFGGDTNRVTILARDRDDAVLPLQSKLDVAHAILDRVAELLPS